MAESNHSIFDKDELCTKYCLLVIELTIWSMTDNERIVWFSRSLKIMQMIFVVSIIVVISDRIKYKNVHQSLLLYSTIEPFVDWFCQCSIYYLIEYMIWRSRFKLQFVKLKSNLYQDGMSSNFLISTNCVYRRCGIPKTLWHFIYLRISTKINKITCWI